MDSMDANLEIAWRPDSRTRERSNLLALMREVGIDDYDDLYRFSVNELEAFWEKTIGRLSILFEKAPERILDLTKGVRDLRWLPGAELEITRSCFIAAPDKPAILFGREEGGSPETITYGELERLVDRFAAGLATRGFQKNDAIALYMPMTPECVVAYLGTVRAGCRVVSVADSFSAEELGRRMRIADARAVVTVSSYRRAGRDIGLYSKAREARTDETAIVLRPQTLDSGDLAWDDFLSDKGLEAHLADPYHATNVLFSSGTTGDPKAIPWTQLTPLKCAMDAHFHQDVHENEVVCWPTNIGWMMGPWLIYASLINRATIALYEGAPAGRGFTAFVKESAVSMLGVVPSMVKNWRAKESVEEGEWSKLRLFSSTGEASNADDYSWLMSRAGYRAPIIEYLGGTEIGGGHLTGTVLQPASPATFTTPALGTRFVILDERDSPVPEGKMGELYLVPPALGLSQTLLNKNHDEVYYGKCPKGPKGEVLRRHGDQIARLPGGYFKAQGRADDTMNLGGIKVGSLERETLRRELGRAIAERLNPLFKIHDVVAIEALPRTASNKVMRRSLRRLYTENG